MRICIYTDSALPKMGVQEHAVDALARTFVALGHEPVVLAPWPKKTLLATERAPYPVLRHPRFFSAHFLTAWYRWFLQNHYERYPFDVLHCHGVYPPSYLAALSRTLIPAPVVVTSYGGDVAEHNARLKNPLVLERIVEGLQAADALIAVNPFARDRLTRLCPGAAARVLEIPQGVHVGDFGERAPRPADLDADIEPGAYAVFIGRLKYRSGVDSLLQAAARTPEHGQVQFVIGGAGEEQALLEILAEQLDLHARVRFVGNVTVAAKQYLLQNARFGIVPSRQWDVSGTAILEGYAAGLPMIATDLPAWSDLIQHEKTGLLVPAEAPGELAAAMTRLFVDDALVQHMGNRALALVHSYDWRLIAERHLALYRSLLPARVARAA